MAGLLAAGAALGFSNQASAGTPVDDAQNLVDEAGAGIKRRIDGLFGKNKVTFYITLVPHSCGIHTVLPSKP